MPPKRPTTDLLWRMTAEAMALILRPTPGYLATLTAASLVVYTASPELGHVVTQFNADPRELRL